MDRDALAWLQSHTQPFEVVEDDNAESKLIALEHNVAIQSLEQFQAQPNRIKQAVKLESVDSFCAYVNRFLDEHTTIYMRTASGGGNGGFEAVLDHHGADVPRWTSHRALFIPERSVEWQEL